MAQITVEMWKSWASLSDQEIAIVVSHAKHNEQPLKNGCKLIVAFHISACDPKKCSITEGVHVHTIQETSPKLVECLQTFIKCGCPLNGPKMHAPVR